MIQNLACAFVEVAFNLGLGRVGFGDSDALVEVFSARKGLPHILDAMSKLIVIRIVTEVVPGCKMYLDVRIFLSHQSFPWVSFLHVTFLRQRMGWQDVLIEAIILRVGVLGYFIESNSQDTAIGFMCLGTTLPMR